MRSTTVVSFFVASWVLASCEGATFLYEWVELNLFLEPAVFAAPVPSQANSALVKRFCMYDFCRVAVAVRTFPYSWFIALLTSHQPSNTDTSQSGVQNLVDVLMNALQTYQAQNAPSSADTTADFATPQDTGAEPVSVVHAMEHPDV